MQRKFSHYLVGRKLGLGGMGEIYLAEDPRLGRNIALKFLAPSELPGEAARRRFFEEARAAATIDHPFICKIYEAGEAEGVAYIAMEYIQGESLDQRLRQGPLPVEQAVKLALEIADALAAAHARGILHRDLKPSNIMLTPDLHVKVVDFGLAKRLAVLEAETMATALTQPGWLIGTLAYMSPEQLQAQPLDARSDLFALGIVFYQMLSGRHPFLDPAGPAGMSAALRILNETPPPLPFPALAPILDRLLAKKSADRFSSARELADALRGRDLHPRATPSATAVAPASLAVLPLVNRGGGEAEEYFSDGMTEEIALRLAQVRGLRVISSRSAMRYKNSPKSLAEIGRELGVGALLEGSVAHTGNRLRIRIALTELSSQSQLWAEAYDRDVGDVLAIQAEVAQKIARALQLRVPEVESPQSAPCARVDPAAYRLYLKARQAGQQMTLQGLQRAWRDFQQALQLEPTYAPIYAALSSSYVRAGNYGFLPPAEAYQLARAALSKALKLEPRLPEAQLAAGMIALNYDWDWPAAERAFQDALAQNSNSAETHLAYSMLLQAVLDRPGEALLEAQRALAIDPLEPIAGGHLAWVLLMQDRHQDALEQIHRTALISPGYLPLKAMQALVLWYLERYQEGNRLIEQFHWTRGHLGWGYAMAGRESDARAILAELGSSPRPPSFDLAFLCLFLGDLEGGLAWFERAWQARDNKLFVVKCTLQHWPRLRRFLNEPSMQAFLARIGPGYGLSLANDSAAPTQA